jgi:cytochrome P450
MDQRAIGEPSLDGFSPFDPRVLESPHPAWAMLRREAPIYRVDMPGVPAPVFMVTRRKEIESIVANPSLFSNHPVPSVWRWGEFESEIAAAFAKCGRKVAFTLATSDPPEAPEYRRIAENRLNRRRVLEMQPELNAVVGRLMAAIPENEPCNFVEAFSVPLPLLVICLILGIPYEDANFIRFFSDEFAHLVDPVFFTERAVKAADTVADGYLYCER